MEAFLESKRTLRELLLHLYDHPELMLHETQERVLLDRITSMRASFHALAAPSAQASSDISTTSGLEENPDAVTKSPPELQMSAQGHVSMAPELRTLSYEVPELLEEISRRSLPLGRFDAFACLERWTSRDQLTRFAKLSEEARGETLHLLIAWILAIQETTSAGDKDALEKRVAAALSRIKDVKGEVWLHGLARTHEPRHGASWREDVATYEQALKGRLAPITQGEPSASKGAYRRAKGSAKNPTMLKLLKELRAKNPDRVRVLESAWSSAREAGDFRSMARVAELLDKLVGPYLDGVLEGGDARAREVFTPNQFAARESETCESNARGRELRTFVYEGKPVEFLRHLKIGNGEDTRSGWRCYFHVDVEREMIVLGHCGAHLDLC